MNSNGPFMQGIAELIGETVGALDDGQGKAFLSTVVLDGQGNVILARVISVGPNEADKPPLEASLMDMPRRNHPGTRILGMVVFAPVATGVES